MKITVQTEIAGSIVAVWNAWITPEDITEWNFASNNWCCPKAEINLEDGGKFNYRMEAKDASMGFDFEGTFIKIIPKQLIEYGLEDNRHVTIEFKETANGVEVIETFEAENEYSAKHQQDGWQSILNNFKQHVESKNS